MADEKTNRHLVLNALVAVALIAAVGSGYLVYRAQQIVVDQNQLLKKALDELKANDSQRNALLYRVLGKTLPMELPQEVDIEIKELEATIQDQSKWPVSVGEAREFEDKVAKVFNAVPPWIEETILPRLLVLRWTAGAFMADSLASTKSESDPEELLNSINQILDNIPDSSPKELVRKLQGRVPALEQAADKAQLNESVARAENALLGKEDPEAALRGLEGFEDPRALSLRTRLREAMMIEYAAGQLKTIKDNLKRYDALAELDIRQAGIMQSYNKVMDLLLSVVVMTEPDKVLVADLKSMLAGLSERIKAGEKASLQEVERNRKAYNKWAMDQILSFDSWNKDQAEQRIKEVYKVFKDATSDFTWDLLQEFPAARSFYKKSLGIDLPDGPILPAQKQREIYEAVDGILSWKKLAELTIFVQAEAIVKYLGPVDPRYLDPSVQQEYERCMSGAWQKLEGDNDLILSVKERIVELEKMTPDTLSFRIGKL